MRGLILTEPGRFDWSDHENIPTEPGPGDALVRVHRVGVCGSDMHAFVGRHPVVTYPRILGHELGVEVVSVGDGVRHVSAGDRCAVEPYIGCGRCPVCVAGRTNCCSELDVLGINVDGGFQEFLLVPARILYPSERLGFESLALVETLGIGAHAVIRSEVKPSDRCLVVGAGPIGLSVTQFLLGRGIDVTAIDPLDVRRSLIRTIGGEAAEHTDDLFDVVFDATGAKTAMESSVHRVAPGGSLVLVGITQEDVSFPDPLIHKREMTIRCSRNSAGILGDVIADIEAGRIDTTPWVTARFGLDQVEAQLPHLHERPGHVKAVVEVS